MQMLIQVYHTVILIYIGIASCEVGIKTCVVIVFVLLLGEKDTIFCKRGGGRGWDETVVCVYKYSNRQKFRLPAIVTSLPTTNMKLLHTVLQCTNH